MMRLLVVFVAIWGVVSANPEAKLGSKTKVDLTREKLRSVPSSFTHVRELLGALTSGQSSFDVTEKMHNSPANLAEYLDLPDEKRSNYDTKTSYVLAADINQHHILDHVSVDKIQELTATGLKHCGESGSIAVDSLLVGGSTGAWYRNKDLQSRLLTVGLLPAHESKESLTLVRRVLSVSALDSQNCRELTTESLSALELFDTVKITSLGGNPFSTNYFFDEGRDLQMTMGYGNIKVDAPVQSCSIPKYSTGSWTIGKGKNYALGLTNGCAEFNTMSPGFNFNYDTGAHAAVRRNVDLSNGRGSGMTCDNCYAFYGDAFLVVINYSLKGMSLLFEVKVNGGAGVNMDLAFSNPTLSSTWNKQLVAPQSSWSTVSLGSSLKLSYKLGGVTVEVSGSGSATGKALVSGGVTGDVQMGSLYNGKSLYSVSNNFKNYNHPTYNGGFTALSSNYGFSASAYLTASMDFSVAAGSYAKADGDVSISSDLAISYLVSSKSSLAASVMREDAERKLQAMGGSDSPSFGPGSSLTVRVTYQDFNPDETHILVYTLETPDGQVHRVMNREFTTDKTGRGLVDASWSVPWDRRFRGNSKMHVKCSNQKSRTAHTQTFSLVGAGRPDQTPFTFPRSHRGEQQFGWAGRKHAKGERGPASLHWPRVQAGRAFKVRWQHRDMRVWRGERGSQFRGADHEGRHVRFFLHGESRDGSKKAVHELSFDQPVDNTGEATLVLPPALCGEGMARFRLLIQQDDASAVGGFSPEFECSASASGSDLPAAPSPPSMYATPVADNLPPVAEQAPPAARALALAKGCANGQIAVNFNAVYSGGISNVHVKILGDLPSWTGDWPTSNLIPPQVWCYSPPKSPPSAPLSSILNPSCSVPGVGSGKCQDSGWACSKGKYYSGYCPGSSSIKCCVATTAATTATTTPATPAAPRASYAACTVPKIGAGRCIATSDCTGYYYSGFCAGAANIKCCVSGSLRKVGEEGAAEAA